MKPIRSLAAVAVAVVLGLSALGASEPATLHLALSKAVPAADAAVAAAPAAIELHFTQAPQAGSTSIALQDAAGTRVTLEAPEADGSDPKVVRAAVSGAVAPGSYQVAWRTMANDGHVIRGEYRFTVKPAT